MSFPARLLLWISTGTATFAADTITKALPHAPVVHNYSAPPAIVFALVGLFLCMLAAWQSAVVVAGAGLMFGGLCGNAVQLVVTGYATDWIPLAGWLTNVADLAGAAGFLLCCTGYAAQFFARRQSKAS